ncbi:MAG: copper-translocating P-type ATPase [Deltaproteobacteria bacterium]|nr:copper-translocating P-type ATPase [Deltaproteobacteria bacterium]
MRISLLVLLGSILLACETSDSAEHSAQVVAARQAEIHAQAMPAALSLTAAKPDSSCGGGATCGGSCGGSCGGGAASAVQWAEVPAGARWAKLQVTGMHCGGCARRIERALAKVDGVVGVEIDVATGSVKVAVASTIDPTDARGLVKPAIDALGYQVR